jgi:GNAT superfamily N-acetyltransferase
LIIGYNDPATNRSNDMKKEMKMNENLILFEPHISVRYIFHQSESDWGGSILIMEKHGKAFARIYWFNDDKTIVYLDWLYVNEEARKKGIGKELQEIREEMGRKLGAITVCLWVDKDSWMHEWYQRRGYEDWKINKNQNNAIWMSKSLINGS